MEKQLPSRPNLDHLRKQAKALLASLGAGDKDAVATMKNHLPSAKDMTPAKIKATQFRLSDAQLAVARQTGFGSWPKLARHVEQLRALEGQWEFVSLEVDGNAVPASVLKTSKLLIDGDRFRTESPEATYEGTFNIDVEADLQQIDIEFVEGPEAGNWNYGIFECVGDTLKLCLDMTGKSRPKAFATKAGSSHAFEVLKRSSNERPEGVKGGVRQQATAVADDVASNETVAAFKYVPSELLTKLQGEWNAEKIVINGNDMPAMVLKTGRRSAKDNEVRVTVGGQTIIHALVNIDESVSPVSIDYLHISGKASDLVQRGIMKWQGDVAVFCMASPGNPRPKDFACPEGSGHTLSHWRREA